MLMQLPQFIARFLRNLQRTARVFDSNQFVNSIQFNLNMNMNINLLFNWPCFLDVLVNLLLVKLVENTRSVTF
jgi:hypothetical protein